MDSSSDHARLEVAILRSETTDASGVESRGTGAGEGRTAYVLAVDPEVRTYIRRCLAEMPRLYVIDGETWDEVSGKRAAAIPYIVIVEAMEIEAAARLLGWDTHDSDQADLPRILILDERPADIAEPPWTIPVVVLTKPFNAQQLLEAVARVLEAPGGEGASSRPALAAPDDER